LPRRGYRGWSAVVKTQRSLRLYARNRANRGNRAKNRARYRVIFFRADPLAQGGQLRSMRERGEGQVLADEISRRVHRGPSADRPAYFQTGAALRSNAGLPAE